MEILRIDFHYRLHLPSAMAQGAGIPLGGEVRVIPVSDGLLIQGAQEAKTCQMTCLGRFSFCQDGKRVSFSCKKLGELLAFLACEAQPMGKQRIAASLWPCSSEDQSMDNLYKLCRTVRDLEQAGIKLPLLISRGEIGLDWARVSCDLERFERLYQAGSAEALMQAVELYRGPLLLEDAYEWSAEYEGRYDIHYLDMLERLTAHFTKLGKPKLARYYKALADGE